MDLLYAHFTQLYAALRTLREAKTLYATLRTWQLADVVGLLLLPGSGTTAAAAAACAKLKPEQPPILT